MGYLRVTNSKIVVYDEDGGEEDSLRYDYSARKELYTLDGGKLFGCGEFTVEKSKKKLKLITEDDDEYILEEIDKRDIPTSKPKPSGGGEETPGPKPAETSPGPSGTDEPDSGYVKLPLGCYAVHDNRSFSYLKVTDRTMILYNDDGSVDAEDRYSYDRDGSCVVVEGGETITILFTYERGVYYMIEGRNSYRLEPVSESEIPVYGGGPSYTDTYYIGGNGSIDLYAWLPDALYDNLSRYEYGDGYFSAQAYGYDYSSGAGLAFTTLILSGDALQDAIEEMREDYYDAYGSGADLLFRSFQDEMVDSLNSGYLFGEYVGYGLDYDLYEGYETINGREWRYCEAYAGDAYAGLTVIFWMEGDDMAAVLMGGIAEDSGGLDDMGGTLTSIIYSLELH